MTPQTDIKPEASSRSQSLCFSLYAANQAMNRIYKSMLSDIGLTYTQYLVLVLLWIRDGQTVGELGHRLFLESNTLTPLLKRLEAMGRVERRRDIKDERLVHVRLTEQGKGLENEAQRMRERILNASGLTPQALDALNQQLTLIQRSLA